MLRALLRMALPLRYNSFMERIIGIDEVGRGPLAGPVTVCAFSVSADFDMSLLNGIRDSKKLSVKQRESWHAMLSDLKLSGKANFAFASVSAKEIDGQGIAPSIRKALASCLESLGSDPKAAKIFLDGSLKAPAQFKDQETVIKGDDKIPVISAASVIAKVERDRHMEEQGKAYPGYGLEKHKGYGTSFHRKAIKELGLSPIHRATFCRNIAF